MVGPGVFLTGLLGVIGLAATGGGFLYRRDSKQNEKIDSNSNDIEEMDRAFVQLTTRLFGHPDDDSDKGAVPERAEEVQRAEENIDSLSEEVHSVKEQAEENGESIDHLDERMTDHAQQTREALHRIERRMDGDVIPDDDGEFLPDGSGAESGPEGS